MQSKPIELFDYKNLLKDNFLESTSVSSTYSYIFDNTFDDEFMKLSFVNFALKTSVLEGLDIGYSYSHLFQSINDKRDQYFFHGPFFDINLFKMKNTNRGFLTFGFYFGNYNMCVEGNPKRKTNLRYVRLGFGYEHKFFIDGLFLKIHAEKYLSVNCNSQSSSYLFPFIGFVYYFEKK